MVNNATLRNKYLNAQRRFFSRFHVYRDSVHLKNSTRIWSLNFGVGGDYRLWVSRARCSQRSDTLRKPPWKRRMCFYSDVLMSCVLHSPSCFWFVDLPSQFLLGLLKWFLQCTGWLCIPKEPIVTKLMIKYKMELCLHIYWIVNKQLVQRWTSQMHFDNKTYFWRRFDTFILLCKGHVQFVWKYPEDTSLHACGWPSYIVHFRFSAIQSSRRGKRKRASGRFPFPRYFCFGCILSFFLQLSFGIVGQDASHVM